MRIAIALLLISTLSIVQGQFKKTEPLAHTYSIVAYDPETGDLGVAVQSHWFSVGTVVTWAEAGVGAIATQSFSNPAFGPQGLQLLKTGLDAKEVLDVLVKSDEGRDYRQLGIVDAQGKTSSFTGVKNIEFAGSIVEENFAIQANLMINDKVWPAMAEAYKSAEGPLAERLISALEAGERAGGDARGKQSAAVLVVSGKPTGKVWIDRKVDLRVDDSDNPLTEIRRLWKVHQAYEFMNRGDLAVEAGDYALASLLYKKAETMFPENLEMQYWHAINLVNTGKIKEALPMFKHIFSQDNNWRDLTPRLIKNEVLVADDKTLKIIMKQ